MADSLSFDVELVAAQANEADERLIEALRQCEEWAYEELIARFQQPVYNLVFRLLPDASETVDVVQEVFIKIFRNIGHFRGKSSLKTWVYRIAVNEAHNHRRWFSRHRKQEVNLHPDTEDEPDYERTLADGAPSAYDRMRQIEAKEEVERALEELSPMFREAVVLRDVEELSYEEIAEVLEINLGTVKSRILRGRQQLEKVLRARLTAEAPGTPERAVTS